VSIAVDGLRVSLGGATVLEGVSFDVPTGCLFGLVGPAGSGKSTLLKAIGALVPHDGGTVRVGEVDMGHADAATLASARRGIGFLFQNYALFDHLSVAENVAFPLRRAGVTDEALLRERVAERLARVSLVGFEARLPATLSGGQKKRVGIARATVTHAPVVLYDDPTAGLDPVTSQKIYDLVQQEQRAQGATVIAIASDVRGLLTIADRVGLLHRGRLVFEGSVEEARTTRDPLVRQFVDGRLEGPL